MFKELPRHYQHPKAFAMFFFLVFVVGEMSSCQSLKIPMLDLITRSPTIVDDHFVNRNVSDAIEQNSNTDVEPEIAAGHDAELHVEPTRNGKDQSEEVVALKEITGGLMMIAMNGPSEGVHHIFMRKPCYELHEPKGRKNPEYVDKDLQSTKF
jgi:hypothetical protein